MFNNNINNISMQSLLLLLSLLNTESNFLLLLLHNPVTMSESQGQSHWYQIVEFRCDYYPKFQRNYFAHNQTQANLKGFFFAQWVKCLFFLKANFLFQSCIRTFTLDVQSVKHSFSLMTKFSFQSGIRMCKNCITLTHQISSQPVKYFARNLNQQVLLSTDL